MLPDLVTANSRSKNVSYLAATGSGAFATPVTFPVGTKPSALTAADVNGDGKLDLVVAHAVSRFVSILSGNGNGGAAQFNPQVRIIFPSLPSTRAIAEGDLDGDGSVDLTLASTNTGTVSAFLGTGHGAFRGPFQYSLDNTPPRKSSAVLLADLDGNGLLDVIVANTGTSDVSVLLNTTA